MCKIRNLVAAIAILGVVSPALAVDIYVTTPPDPVESTDINAYASVVPGCLITNAAGIESDLDGRTDVVWGSIDFGSVPAAGEDGRTADVQLAWNTSIKVACTPGISLSMTVDSGLNGSRLLKNDTTGSTLQYYLFSSSAMTAADAIPENSAVDLAPFSIDYANVVFPIFARVTLPQVSATGTYTDTLTVTLDWM